MKRKCAFEECTNTFSVPASRKGGTRGRPRKYCSPACVRLAWKRKEEGPVKNPTLSGAIREWWQSRPKSSAVKPRVA